MTMTVSPSEVFAYIPTRAVGINGNTVEEPIYRSYIEQMQALYPAIDVAEETLKAVAWCINNPRKRKTQVKRYLGNWYNNASKAKGNQKKKRDVDTEWINRNGVQSEELSL